MQTCGRPIIVLHVDNRYPDVGCVFCGGVLKIKLVYYDNPSLHYTTR